MLAPIGTYLHSFPGGLKLKHYKAMSCQQSLPVPRLPLSAEYVIPVSQHSGSEDKLIVTVGQKVLKGTAFSSSEQATGAAIHAPTSGLITAIEARPVPHQSGLKALCVIMEADGEDRWAEMNPCPDYQELTATELITQVRAAGIVGLGGAVFPTATKLAGTEKIHTLILNGAECEPYIACDEILMQQAPEKIIQGAQILCEILAIPQAIIAIEDPMENCQKSLDKAILQAGAEALIKVVKVPMLYPEGGERQLVQVLTGEEVPAGGLPLSLGLLVQNVATVAAISDAIIHGKPLLERIVTVTGNGIVAPQNMVASFGTPISELVDFCGGYTPSIARLIMGGPLMGLALNSDSLPLIKASNCILGLSSADVSSTQPEFPCINCGFCVSVCPAGLLPQTLQTMIRSENFSALEPLHLEACIECGCCDYVCPSHIPLVNYFRYGKDQLQQLAIDKQKSTLARERYELREQRLEKQQTERRARHQKRKQALAGSADKQTSIAAAVARAKAKKQQPEGSDS